MHRRHILLSLICMSVLAILGLQSLSAKGAPIVKKSTPGRDILRQYEEVNNGVLQEDESLFLPFANNKGTAAVPTATSTVTPTATSTITPTATSTVTPTATSTVEPGPIPSSTPIAVDDAELFVDDTNTSGTEDGSPEHPFTSLQAAVDTISDSEPITIAVAAGVYTENVHIENKTVHLYGGFVGGSAADYSNGDGGDFEARNPLSNTTHIQGDGTDSAVTLLEPGLSTVDGFRITGGARSKTNEFSDRGGGFFVSGGSPTISFNLVENNNTIVPGAQEKAPVGGGIYAENSNILIQNNTIRNNISGRGAGVGIDGGIVRILDNIVQGNRGVSLDNGDHGGGLYIFSPQAEISRNLITGNEIGREIGWGWGGGVYVHGEGTFATISYNIITQNYARVRGSGVFIDNGAQAVLDHELIYNNQCVDGETEGGVGVYVDGLEPPIGSHATIIHSTIADNGCATSQAGNGLFVEVFSSATVQNSIFWGNGVDDYFVDDTSQITVTYTLSGEEIEGEGNLNDDPIFADAQEHDYHLQSTTGRWEPAANGGSGDWIEDRDDSPGIDAADPASSFAKEPTPNGGRANLGVYGNTVEASKSAP